MFSRLVGPEQRLQDRSPIVREVLAIWEPGRPERGRAVEADPVTVLAQLRREQRKEKQGNAGRAVPSRSP